MTINLNEDKNLRLIVNDYEKYFIKLCDVIELPKEWNINRVLEIEIKKSFARGMLRYSEDTSKILKFIKNYYEENLIKPKKLNWITLPYPMIHLSNDLLEDGGYHYDEISKKKSLYLLDSNH